MRGYSLQTVERTLRLLDAFAARPTHGWSLSELSRVLGVHKATVLRMLSTLERHGYMIRENEPPRYRLGPSAMVLGWAAVRSEVREMAYPELRRLTEETGETSLLHVVSGHETVCIDKVESPQPVRVTFDIGRRGPLHAGSSGKSLLAFLDSTQIERLLSNLELLRYTDLTITDAEELRRELSLVRERGYAISYGELDNGVYSVGAPIWNGLGRLEAGVTLVGPDSRWTEERLANYAEKTLAAARRISERLGHGSASVDGDGTKPSWTGQDRAQPSSTQVGKED
jgi:DNA-binding IclR family transcriptional regulator